VVGGQRIGGPAACTPRGATSQETHELVVRHLTASILKE
jgi:hypothetical protein